MAFRFSLVTLLRVREIAEEREERLLGQILSKLAQGRQDLHDLQRKYIELLHLREQQLRLRMSAAELHVSYGQMQALEELQKIAQEQVLALEKLRDQQMRVYEAAHRDLEVLQGLREKQLDAFRYKQRQQEQNVMDDNFVSACESSRHRLPSNTASSTRGYNRRLEAVAAISGNNRK